MSFDGGAFEEGVAGCVSLPLSSLLVLDKEAPSLLPCLQTGDDDDA